MSKLLSKISAFFKTRTMAGVDKAGNRYFTRTEELDGVMKEKRWVIFKGEDDPTTVPVEWICWLNGQRKKAPTPEEMIDLEARRESLRINVALLKKEEAERKAKEGGALKSTVAGKVGGPDLKSFVRQFPSVSEDDRLMEASDATNGVSNSREAEAENTVPPETEPVQEISEPTGSGASFRPGTWQPPT